MKKILLLLAIVLMGSNVYGQDVDSLTVLEQEIKELKEKYRSKLELYEKLNDEHKKLSKKYKNINITEIQSHITHLKQKEQDINKDIISKKRELNNLKIECNELAKERNKYIARIVKRHEVQLTKPLKEIKSEDLISTLNECEEFIVCDNDKGDLASLKEQIKQLKEYVETYNSAIGLLNNKYNKIDISTQISRLNELKKEMSVESQKADMDKAIDLLSKYEIGINVLIHCIDYIKGRTNTTPSLFNINNNKYRALTITEDSDLGRLGLAGINAGKLFDEYVKPIPYLMECYNRFKKKPSKDSEVIMELEEYKQTL